MTILSQVCHRDVYMYLLAIKSLCRFVRPRRIVVLDDTSLTASDRQVLAQHIEEAYFRSIADVPNGSCPRGVCWERLLSVADTVSDSYVIQLDSDTLTLLRPAEVIEHVVANRSFTLGTRLGPTVVSMKEACAAAQARRAGGHTPAHVQEVAEAAFDRLSGFCHLRYVRGSAGFAGYAQGSVTRAAVEDFSTAMGAIIGEQQWAHWGSDQVASNYLIANTPAACVLPLARYHYYSPQLDVDGYTFLHFIGTHRFKRNAYVRLARRVVTELARSDSAAYEYP